MKTEKCNQELGGSFGTQVRDFRYDVLNRLKSSKVQGSNAYAAKKKTISAIDAANIIYGITRLDGDE